MPPPPPACETPVRPLLPPPLAATSSRQVCPPTKEALRESLALERATTALAGMPSPELESSSSDALIAELQARVRELESNNMELQGNQRQEKEKLLTILKTAPKSRGPATDDFSDGGTNRHGYVPFGMTPRPYSPLEAQPAFGVMSPRPVAMPAEVALAETAQVDVWASPLLATAAAAAAATAAQPPLGTPGIHLLELEDLLELGASLATPTQPTPAQLAVKLEAPAPLMPASAPAVPASAPLSKRLEPKRPATFKREPDQEPAPRCQRLGAGRQRTAAVKSQLSLSDFPVDCEVRRPHPSLLRRSGRTLSAKGYSGRPFCAKA